MIEITRQISGFAVKLETTQNVKELIDWALSEIGVAVTMSARASGELHIQCEGLEIATVYPALGNWLVFDGEKFIVYEDDAAFESAGYQTGN